MSKFLVPLQLVALSADIGNHEICIPNLSCMKRIYHLVASRAPFLRHDFLFDFSLNRLFLTNDRLVQCFMLCFPEMPRNPHSIVKLDTTISTRNIIVIKMKEIPELLFPQRTVTNPSQSTCRSSGRVRR